MTSPPTSENWRGGLVDGMRDASGQMYRRNRYYDPGTGQFTQPDPIGIAGGLNVYGFANGDPVSYSDPYGLAACDRYDRSDCSKWELVVLGTADRLRPVQPALNVAFEIIMVASPDPLGEGKLLWKAFSNAEDAAQYLVKGGMAGDNVGNSLRAGNAAENGTFFVDKKGNVIPTPPGGRITGSPDGRYLQARDAAGNPTGVRIDAGHKPSTHPDPRAQRSHGHVPGRTNADGTPWLPVKQ